VILIGCGTKLLSRDFGASASIISGLSRAAIQLGLLLFPDQGVVERERLLPVMISRPAARRELCAPALP